MTAVHFRAPNGKYYVCFGRNRHISSSPEGNPAKGFTEDFVYEAEPTASFIVEDRGHHDFWSRPDEETLSKYPFLPKWLMKKALTMGVAFEAIERFCEQTGFKNGNVVIHHVIDAQYVYRD